MSSLKEKMKDMPRIKIDASEAFVLEVQHHDFPVAEIIISVDELSYEAKDGMSHVELSVFNPYFMNTPEIKNYPFRTCK